MEHTHLTVSVELITHYHYSLHSILSVSCVHVRIVTYYISLFCFAWDVKLYSFTITEQYLAENVITISAKKVIFMHQNYSQSTG